LLVELVEAVEDVELAAGVELSDLLHDIKTPNNKNADPVVYNNIFFMMNKLI
jgi:hypothetical protein